MKISVNIVDKSTIVNELPYDGPIPAVGDEIMVMGGNGTYFNVALKVVRKITRIEPHDCRDTHDGAIGHVVLWCQPSTT